MKIYNFKHFYMTIAFSLCSILAIAQPKVPTVIHSDPVGHPNPTHPAWEIGPCGEGIEFDIFVANLDLLVMEGIEGVIFGLPEDVPDLYVELNIISDGVNSFNILSELTLFEFSHVEDGVNLYKASILADVSPGGQLWTLRLLREGESNDLSLPQGYSYYPMLEYRSAGNLFPCDLRTENGEPYFWPRCMADCSESILDCSASTVIGLYDGYFYCNPEETTIVGPGFNQLNDGYAESSESLLGNFDNFVSSQFLPNPFSFDIRCSFDLINEGVIDIELFSVSGQLMQRWERDVVKGKNNFNLLVNEIPSGVYFIKYSDGKDSSIKKMIRM